MVNILHTPILCVLLLCAALLAGCGTDTTDVDSLAIVGTYTDLTGKPPVPPEWAFGLWASTCFVKFTEASVLETARRLRQEGIPCDVFHLDSFWQRAFMWCDFEWDAERLPDPRRAACTQPLHPSAAVVHRDAASSPEKRRRGASPAIHGNRLVRRKEARPVIFGPRPAQAPALADHRLREAAQTRFPAHKGPVQIARRFVRQGHLGWYCQGPQHALLDVRLLFGPLARHLATSLQGRCHLLAQRVETDLAGALDPTGDIGFGRHTGDGKRGHLTHRPATVGTRNSRAQGRQARRCRVQAHQIPQPATRALEAVAAEVVGIAGAPEKPGRMCVQ